MSCTRGGATKCVRVPYKWILIVLLRIKNSSCNRLVLIPVSRHARRGAWRLTPGGDWRRPLLRLLRPRRVSVGGGATTVASPRPLLRPRICPRAPATGAGQTHGRRRRGCVRQAAVRTRCPPSPGAAASPPAPPPLRVAAGEGERPRASALARRRPPPVGPPRPRLARAGDCAARGTRACGRPLARGGGWRRRAARPPRPVLLAAAGWPPPTSLVGSVQVFSRPALPSALSWMLPQQPRVITPYLLPC